MLTPLFESSPSPFDRRRTISAASSGLLETISFARSRSYQRNAGMPSLLPWRIPAWLAEVIEGRIASHRESLWVLFADPAAHRVDRAGADADWRGSGWASPSIWMITSPGLSVFSFVCLASRLETSRPK